MADEWSPVQSGSIAMKQVRSHIAMLLLTGSVIGVTSFQAVAADDPYVKEAKDYVASASAPVTDWAGPTEGPKSQGKKMIIYVSADQRNGGAQGVSDGAKEAAAALGWEFRTLDGQGTVPGATSALTQAVALKPDGIVLGSIDAAAQAPAIEAAAAQGIKIVGWHAGAAPGKIDGAPSIFVNLGTNPEDVARAAGLYAVADSDGKAGVILFTDSIYAISTSKTNATKAAIEKCTGCKVLSVEDTPLADLSNRMGQLTTSLLSKYGDQWTYSIAINDLYYDFATPSLQSAGIDPASGYPRSIASGDGSPSAFQRIREKQYQVATVGEPLNLLGWQAADELNRSFAGQQPSGYVVSPHLSVNSNVDKDGGDQNKFDPNNGYRDHYKSIWGVK
ncbi:MAG: sugar ABC transporter substrate-binding protein [Mesorhizobium sp.]|nr:MAG: sugar ABC transporter substrate-binding protein [Mesorhizobium sp.]